MLLAAYLISNGYPNPWRTADSHSMHWIERFEFGDRYGIKCHTGKTFDFPDLEDILDVMRSEFMASGRVPIIGFYSPAFMKRLYSAPPRVLTVTANNIGDSAHAFGHASTIRTEEVVEQVRRAVTMYNLTQSWDQFTKGNL